MAYYDFNFIFNGKPCFFDLLRKTNYLYRNEIFFTMLACWKPWNLGYHPNNQSAHLKSSFMCDRDKGTSFVYFCLFGWVNLTCNVNEDDFNIYLSFGFFAINWHWDSILRADAFTDIRAWHFTLFLVNLIYVF